MNFLFLKYPFKFMEGVTLYQKLANHERKSNAVHYVCSSTATVLQACREAEFSVGFDRHLDKPFGPDSMFRIKDWQTGWGMVGVNCPHGEQNGMLGYEQIAVEAPVPYHACISAHPPSSVVIEVDERYKKILIGATLNGTALVNDTRVMTFSVFDREGKELSSRDLARRRFLLCDPIKVPEDRILSLECGTSDDAKAHAVWLFQKP
jgi:CheY-like chemotaxis protein